MYFAVKSNPKYLLEILTSVILFPPQDDRINRLKTPLRMTCFRESPFPPTLSFLMGLVTVNDSELMTVELCHSDRVTARSDEESRVCTP